MANETNTVAMSGNDVVMLNDRIFNDLATGKFATLTYPNKIAKTKTGKNGNTIYALDATGKNAVLKIRTLRGSSDDKWLNNLLNIQQNDFVSFPLIYGEFVKKIGNGAGKVANDTYLVAGGVFTQYPQAEGDSEGDPEQSVAEYEITFARAPRILT